MRKIIKKIVIYALAITMIFSSEIVKAAEKEETQYVLLFEEAVTNNDIRYSYKDGVLTLSGKGIADNSYTKLCKKEDVRKLVINQGIIAIGDNAFSNCNNLTSVTIPETVKSIGHVAFYNTGLTSIIIPKTVKNIGEVVFGICKLKKVTMPGDFNYIRMEDEWVDNIFHNMGEIHLNTSFKKKNMGYLRANKIYTSKNDKKYKSYKGIVYSKNGKKLVMVPYNTKVLKIRKGCKTISMNALAYSSYPEDEYIPYCQNLKKIVIPSTVKYIVDDMEYTTNMDVFKKCKWTINTNKLTGRSIENLLRMVPSKTKKNIIKSPKYHIKKNNGMYITKDNILLKYNGKAKNVTIPAKIKRIGYVAFCNNNKIKSVKLSKNLKEIGNHAFSECTKLSKVKWNKKIKRVGAYAFYKTNIKTLKLPNSVTSWGKSCFAYSNISKLTFSKTMKKIPEGMFEGLKVKNLVIPGNIKKIGRCAFGQSEMNTLSIREGVKEIGYRAFDESDKIKSVVIAKSVAKIENQAFTDTTIDTLEFKGTDLTIGTDAFDSVGEIICDTTPEKYITKASYGWYDINGNAKLYVTKVKNASGLELEYSKNEDFSNAIAKKIDNKTYDFEIATGIQGNPHLRIRPYTNVNGKAVYGKWSLIN